MSFPGKMLFVVVYMLVSIGVVMTYSASAIYAQHVYGNSSYFLIRQLVYVLIGTGFLFFTAVIPIGFWRKNARLVMLLAILLMVLVWNASASAPVGFYRVQAGGPIDRGDMVVAWTPEPARSLAARRRYCSKRRR